MASGLLEAQLGGALAQVEQAVDDQLSYLDNLGDDDLEKIRKKRLGEMRKHAEKKREWSMLGHGKVSYLSERDFFDCAKKSDRVVICFHRHGSSRYSDDLISHLEKIAAAHLETKFVVVDAEKSPFLTDRLKIWCLPSIALVKNGRTDKTFHGLNEICPKGNLNSCVIEHVLFDQRILTTTALSDEASTCQRDDDLRDL